MKPAMPSNDRRSSGPNEERNCANREGVGGAAMVTRPTLARRAPLLQLIGDKQLQFVGDNGQSPHGM
jgi:hypothetical protein